MGCLREGDFAKVAAGVPGLKSDQDIVAGVEIEEPADRLGDDHDGARMHPE